MAFISQRETSNIGKENRTLTQIKKEFDNSIAGSLSQTSNPFNNPKRDNYQTYPYDYFSGTDCKVFFGDIWVDDIITVQYNITQSKSPIYGYASQYYQGIALGQILVNGVLTIAFKEVGYLNTIMALLESQRNRADASINKKFNKIKENFNDTQTPFIPGVTDIFNAGGQSSSEVRTTSINYNPNGTPDIIRSQQTIESILIDKKGIVGEGFVSDYFGDNKTRDFEDVAELLEDTIWGDSDGRPFNDWSKYPRIKRADEFDYMSSSGGKISNGDFPLGIKVPKGQDYTDCLNILLTFGDINDFRAEHTLIALNDIHFTGQTLICSPDGNPIAEQYTFFARNINRNLGTKTFNFNPLKLKVGDDTLSLSKYEDVEKMGQMLESWDRDTQFKLEFMSAFDTSWSLANVPFKRFFVTNNRTVPYIDSLIAKVEEIVNNALEVDGLSKNGTQLDLSKSQYIIQVYPISSIDNTGKPTSDISLFSVPKIITMVIKQTIPNTYTYRVISPTRTNFTSFNTVTRDDLWLAAAPPVEREKEDETIGINSSEPKKDEKLLPVAPKPEDPVTPPQGEQNKTEAKKLPSGNISDTSTELIKGQLDKAKLELKNLGNIISPNKSIFGTMTEEQKRTLELQSEIKLTESFLSRAARENRTLSGDELKRLQQTSILKDTEVKETKIVTTNVGKELDTLNILDLSLIKNIKKKRFEEKIENIEKDFGEFPINSAYRTFKEQTEFRARYERGEGNFAMEPGTSPHEDWRGLDVPRQISADPEFSAAAKKEGFYQPLNDPNKPIYEPHHWTLKEAPISKKDIAKEYFAENPTNNVVLKLEQFLLPELSMKTQRDNELILKYQTSSEYKELQRNAEEQGEKTSIEFRQWIKTLVPKAIREGWQNSIESQPKVPLSPETIKDILAGKK